ncbi:MAG: peptidoglycan-binding domain-containing protein [Tateyamaria sp.]|uniref:peptidoglycan-binding domain-containing protein n=1 Tax=Tateyamaria sp. TaxID=1929288 RepID=UPI0032852C58
MAVLKRGAKGNQTKNAQKLLNRNGARLDEDGIFGPLTEAATKKFQKKVNQKPSGQIDQMTLAALNYGKPLPEMKTSDYVKFMAKLKKDKDDNADIIAINLNAKNKLYDAYLTINRETEKAYGAYCANGQTWHDIFKLGGEVVVMQKQFEKLQLKDPAAAEKLAKECAALDAKILSLGQKKSTAQSQEGQ